jgi:hypothetical protein
MQILQNSLFPLPKSYLTMFYKIIIILLAFQITLFNILVCIFIDMNTLEFARITVDVYEYLEQK